MTSHVANPVNTFENPMPIRSSYNGAIENAYAATARALKHVTNAYGVKSKYISEVSDPDLPIHYTTFIGIRRRLRVVYSRAFPMLKPLMA